MRIGGPILGAGLSVFAPIPVMSWISSKADNNRGRLGTQVPVALDSLAAGLAAGLTLRQALEYSAGELPQPIGGLLSLAAYRHQLGTTWRYVFDELLAANPDRGLALALDGIDLQLDVGGDLVRHLEDTADLVRHRLELEAEVKAVTAQGRLSGWVIGGLVPVSAGLLMATNPTYMSILFETVPGQLLLVASILLQFVGWIVISKLIRLET
jgi:tight adherence protein B